MRLINGFPFPKEEYILLSLSTPKLMIDNGTIDLIGGVAKGKTLIQTK